MNPLLFNTLLSVIDRSSRQTISKDTVELNSTIKQLDLVLLFTEYFIQQQQNTHSFQAHVEHSPKSNTL